MLSEYDSSYLFKNSYFYGNYIDEVLLGIKAGSVYYFHDHLYSPVALVDFYSPFNVLERYQYDAYGNCTVLEPNFAADPDGKSDYANNYLFTGRRLDILDNSSLKIQYNRNRYYDNQTGRWLSHDPLGITPNPQKQNAFRITEQYRDSTSLYEYARSNPVKFLDSFGYKAGEICHGIVFKRKPISLKGSDKYGHWWVEIDSKESYGWWPEYRVGLWETLIGVPGELNAVSWNIGGTPTKDPEHGRPAPKVYKGKIRKSGVLSYDGKKIVNKPCGKCVSCEDIKVCIKSFAQNYSGQWSWPFGQNCQSFQKSMMKACCLRIKK